MYVFFWWVWYIWAVIYYYRMTVLVDLLSLAPCSQGLFHMSSQCFAILGWPALHLPECWPCDVLWVELIINNSTSWANINWSGVVQGLHSEACAVLLDLCHSHGDMSVELWGTCSPVSPPYHLSSSWPSDMRMNDTKWEEPSSSSRLSCSLKKKKPGSHCVSPELAI